eukprot:m.215832 g.215832  ORF g.215832 m.215832 type:complete len:50 (-) comp15543_c0_seq25:2965-3114(-)
MCEPPPGPNGTGIGSFAHVSPKSSLKTLMAVPRGSVYILQRNYRVSEIG